MTIPKPSPKLRKIATNLREKLRSLGIKSTIMYGENSFEIYGKKGYEKIRGLNLPSQYLLFQFVNNQFDTTDGFNVNFKL